VSKFIVRKAAVLGAGVMGAQIAAHLVNAKVQTLLFDLPSKEGPMSSVAIAAIESLRKANPAPLGHPELAAHIEPANYDEDLERLRDCDLVIEAIAERVDWKHALYAKVAPFIAPHAIFGTNTSGLPICELAAGVGETLGPRFCGVHFFNPPRYMPLVELIATAGTDPSVLDRLEGFLTSTLGKHCLRAKDTPNFIANRVGIWGMLATILEAERFGLGFDVVDDLTGPKLGRAKSGTFRTADIVGLDTIGHVMKTMQERLSDDPFHALYDTPGVLRTLIDKGALGQKRGAGFYRKEGKAILRFDPESGNYVPAGARADETVARILRKKTWSERLGLARESKNPQAQFVWALMRDNFQYAACQLEGIAESARDLDLALRLGYGASEGPFEIWQQAGWAQVAGWIREDIEQGRALSAEPLPAWVFEGPVADRGGVHQAEGSWSPATGCFVPRAERAVYRRQLFAPSLAGEGAPAPASAGRTLFEDESIRLWTHDHPQFQEVLVATLRTKMHAIGPGVVAGLMRGVEVAEREYQGLVVWSPDDPFSVGADLPAMLPVFMSGGVEAIEAEELKLQELMLRLRYAQVPTVAAVSGMALGGGCELLLHCARRVASLESYIGLVEVGVGLIPGAGGLAFGARRAAEEQAAAPDAYLLDFLKKYVMSAGTAQVSRSAIEARAAGWLLESEPIVFNRDELLYVALREALALHDSGWRPPRRAALRSVPRAGTASRRSWRSSSTCVTGASSARTTSISVAPSPR
jgi:3-hydroxyacyl-CoA dehydrogenase